MIYKGIVNGKRIETSNLELLVNCESVDIFINGFWQVWR